MRDDGGNYPLPRTGCDGRGVYQQMTHVCSTYPVKKQMAEVHGVAVSPITGSISNLHQ
jgi:hypothetical protein